MNRLRFRNSVYYYRAKLPADIRKLLGRAELSYSLGTADHSSALALSLEMSASQLRLCRVLRHSGRTMTKEQLDQVVSNYMESFRENREQDALAFGRVSPQFAQQRRTHLAVDLHHAENALAENNLEDVQLLARDLLAQSGLHVRYDSPEFQRLCFRLLSSRVDMFREDAKRLPVATPLSVPSGSPKEPIVNGPKLSELSEEYLKYRDTADPMKPNSRVELIAAFAAMFDLLGDQHLASVRNKDAQGFALKYAQLPNRWRTRKEFKGKSASELLALTAGKGIPTAKPATINKEIGMLKTFWTWACLREERPLNPMDAVEKLPVGKVKDKRHPFSESELESVADIINAERKSRPDRYWITTVLAYTGARLEEVAQLRTSDVITQDGVTCIHILDEAGSVKNDDSERVIPIHSAVIAKGFLEYVAKRPKGSRLWFDDEKPGGYGGAISTWFGRQLNELDIENRKKKGLHSLRHTMIDRLRAAKVDPLLRREITGHAHEDVEDRIYGSADGLGIKAKQEALELVKLPI